MKRLLLALFLFGSAAGAFAHIPVSTNPFIREGCTVGLTDLNNSWAVMGALLQVQQVDFICMDATPDTEIKASVVIPAKAAYAGPNDVTMVLVGPGLPAPGAMAVPEGLPMGDGAVFAQIHPDEGPFPKRISIATSLELWNGPRIDVTPPASGRYELRVYSPSDWHGEYYVIIAGNDPNSASSNLNDTVLPTPGDVDQDGQLTINDAILAMIIALGIEPIPSTFALSAGDVAPPGDPASLTIPGDGMIDLADATPILRRVMGLDNSPDWPD